MRIGLGGISGTNILSIGRGVSVGGGGGVQPQPFVGPYDDIPSIAALYAMRRALSDYTGPILRLRRDSDNTEQDIGYIANGDLDTAALASWLGEANGYITTWYDQSGNGNHATQATAAAQPLYVASGQNSRPVVRFDGTDDNLPISATMTVGSILALASSSRGATFPSYDGILSGHATTNNRYYFIGEVGTTNLFTGTGTTFAGEIWIDGAKTTNFSPLADMKIVVGVDTTPTSGTGHVIGSDRLIGGRYWRGDIPEMVIASAAWDSTQRSAAESAANSYWSLY